MKTKLTTACAGFFLFAAFLFSSFTSEAQTDANFVFTPSSVSVEQGETFQVTVSIETDQPVSVADLNLTYDTDFVICNAVILDNFDLDENQFNPLNIDNSTGSITFGAFALEDFPTSTFDFITIEFLAVAETSTPTIVDHILTGVPRSEIAFGGLSILGVANTLEITVTCLDSDDDGVCDRDDICPGGDDAADQDSDGIPDFCDNCVDQVNPTAIAIDGDISDFGPAIGSDGPATYYFAADDQFFYVGVDGINLDNDNIFIAIRTDEGTANSAVDGVDFTSEGWTYRVGFFGADDVCYFPSSNNSCQQQFGGWQNFKGFGGNPVSELRMPRSFFGTLGSGSGNMEIAIWANNGAGDFVFSTFPDSNPTGSTDVGFSEYGSVSYPSIYQVDQDDDGFGVPCDCNDLDLAINPNATEICDGIDNDCMGGVDDNVTSADATLIDLATSDGSLSPAFSSTIFSYTVSVCNDADIEVDGTAANPAASISGLGTQSISLGSNTLTVTVDACGITQDYTITVNAEIPTLYYVDADNDGFGGAGATAEEFCEDPGSPYVTNNSDCDDTDPFINPNATEICDGIDNDCMGGIDDNVSAADATLIDLATSDGSLDPAFSPSIFSYTVSVCDDADIEVDGTAANPAASISGLGTQSISLGANTLTVTVDACGITQDYTITVNAETPTLYYADLDTDGFGGVGATPQEFCEDPGLGFSTNNSDCDDLDPQINPNAPEICDGVDNDCDGDIDTDDSNFDDNINPVVTCESAIDLYLDENGQAILPVSLTALANSELDFSSTQGDAGWTYGVYPAFDASAFTQLSYDNGSNRYEGGQSFETPFIDATGGHPGVDNLITAVRRWTSDLNGPVSISGEFFDRDGNCGDGANVRIFKNGDQIYEFLNIPTSSTSYSIDINVAIGDEIDFVIDPKFDAGCDNTQFTATIEANTASATDDCSVSSLVADQTSFTCANLGSNTVVFTATDGSSNQGTCSSTVNVIDTITPVITCPTTLASYDNDAGLCSASLSFAATAMDNCSATVSYEVDGVAITFPYDFPVGSTTVSAIAADASGNTATCSFDVTVTDNETPVVTGNITASDIEGCDASAAPAVETTVLGLEALAGDLDISDNCSADGDLTVASSDAIAGTCPTVITRTYTVTDEAGVTSASFVHVINVDDTTLPTASAPAAVDVQCLGDIPAVDIAVVTDEADNCGTAIVAHVGDANNSGAGTTLDPLEITRTYSVTDACGNSIEVDQIITVIDDTAPVVTGSITASAIEGCSAGDAPAAETTVAGLEALAGDLDISDNCSADGDLTVASSDAIAGTCPTVITRTYTVTDEAGVTSASFVHVINVDDTTLPTASAPAAVDVQCLGDVPAVDIAVVTDEADNCGTAIVAHVGDANNSGAGTTLDPLEITRTYSVTDACGNSIEVDQIITVIDDTAPVVTGSITASAIEGCSAGDAPAAETTVAGLEALAGDLDISDNCSADNAITVSSNDAVAGTCPTVITRTYTVTDEAGVTSASFVHVINVDDTTLPTASAPAAVDVQCLGDVPAVDITVVTDEADNCGTAIVAHVGDANNSGAGTTLDPLEITRTYSVTDACGNSIEVDQIITVIDDTAPVVTGSITASAIEGCSAGDAPAAETTVAGLEALAGDLDISDNCSADGDLTVASSDAIAGTCPTVITRTYTVTDEAGVTSASFVHVINVDDTTLPTASAPAAVDVQCLGDVPAVDIAVVTDEADNCGTAIVAHVGDANNSGAGTTLDPLEITRTYSVTDACGNSIEVDQIITVIDDTAPVVTGSITASAIEGCSAGDAPAAETTVAGLEGLAGDLDISDNCSADGDLTVASSDAIAGTCPTVITRTYTVTDEAGVTSASFVHVINVDDTTLPTASAPAAVDVQCLGDVPAVDITVVTDEADNCGTAIVAHVGDANNSGAGTTLDPLEITRTYSVTDACGNSIEVDQIITVIDDTAPVVTGSITASAIEGCSAGDAPAAETTVAGLEALAGDLDISDNCSADGDLTVASSDAIAGTCPTVITRTYTVTDEAGVTSASFVHVINVDDTTLPTASAPAAVDVQCLGDVPAVDITVVTDEADNCGTAIVAHVGDANNSGAGTTLDPLEITRTYSVTDACGNSIEVDQIITVIDDTAPVVTGSITASAIEGCSAGDAPAAETTVAGLEALAGDLDISDNCSADGDLTVASSDAIAGTCPTVITRTYTVTDEAGVTSASFVHVINVDDTTLPTASAPAAVDVQCLGDVPAVDITVVTDEADNCGTAIVAHVGDANNSGAGTTLDPLEITRTYSVTDACGNSIEVDQIITVIDDTAPVVTGSITASAIEGCSAGDAPAAETTVAGLEALAGDLDISDNCSADGDLTVASSDAIAGTCPTVITRTYTVTDATGNSSASFTHVINVDDTTPPTASDPAPVSVQCVGDVPAVDITVVTDEEDICGMAVVAHVGDASNGGAGTILDPLEITRTYSVTDACGNFIEVDQIITVVDNQAPITPVLPNVTAQCTASLTAPTTTDNCAGVIVGTTSNPTSYSSQGSFDVTWTFDDGNGNITTAVQSVFIDDTTPPVPDVLSLATVTAECAVVSLTPPTATDNCGGTVTVSNNATLPITAQGNTVVTWSFNDGNGNVSTQNQIVAINDVTAPVISCASDGSRTVSETNNTYLVSGNEFDATATDNCLGVVSITHNAATVLTPQMGPNDVSLDGWEFPIGTTFITFTATDAEGNQSGCAVAVTVTNVEVSGTLTLNGACLPLNMTISLYEPGTPNPAPVLAGTFTGITIDASGDFSFDATGIVPGSYDVYIKVDTYLTEFVGNYTISNSATGITGSGFRPGDISDLSPDLVDALDLSILLDAYNTVLGNPAYDGRADLNCDNVVDALDLSLLIFFYQVPPDSPVGE